MLTRYSELRPGILVPRLPLLHTSLAAFVYVGCAPSPSEADETPAHAVLIDADEDGWALPLDCDDTLAGIHPGAAERCNDTDDDCDGVVDDHPLDGIVGWLDVDGDGWGDSATRDLWCGDPDADARPWVVSSGDCDDGDARVNPGAFESCATAGDDNCDGNDNDPRAQGCTSWYLDLDGDGYGVEDSACLCVAEGSWRAEIDGDCDDNNADIATECGLAGAASLPGVGVIVVGNPDRRQAGAGVESAGDLDGDGHPDLLVLPSTARGNGTWWLVRGPFEGPRDLSAANATFTAPDLGVPTALTASGGIDVNGDGGEDLVLGQLSVTGGSRWRIDVWLYATAQAGNVDVAEADTHFEQTGLTAGSALTLVLTPDTDGDGVGDIALGAAAGSLLQVYAGGADVGAVGPGLEVAQSGIDLGRSLAALGDVDGDGLGDLLVGAPNAGSGGRGGALLVAGGITGRLAPSEAGFVLAGERDGDAAGLSVAAPGDVDGDGYPDLLVGGPAATSANNGRVWLLSGPITGDTDLADATARIDGSDRGDGAWHATRIGDIDGDGLADVAIGGADASAGGLVGIFFGPITGALQQAEADVRLYGARDDRAGSSLAGLGDVDGDGTDDLAIGAPASPVGGLDAGAAYVVFGGAR